MLLLHLYIFETIGYGYIIVLKQIPNKTVEKNLGQF